ncbi:MAG: radical SAM protein [Calditrichaeota bacterium]|nr:MAG: radical SAM protein [Calditrichota bacterium]
MLKINEIYQSVQGESTYVGLPCVFVRLSGCDLRCSYCDTEYAFYEGTKMSLEEVLQKIKNYDCNLVEVTGGEPLLQKKVYELFDLLLEQNYEVMLETGGHISVEKVPKEVIKIVDVKTPSSKMSHKNFYENLSLVDEKDELKFVIGSREDYAWAKELLAKNNTKGKVLFSPVWNELEPDKLVAWILEDKLQVRFQLQMHKVIWAAETQGV